MNTSSHSLGAHLGRNDPCHCGSGKKYKRCHGAPESHPIQVAESSGKAATPTSPLGGAGAPDMASMQETMQLIQRLPRAQLAQLQGIMQKAMAGKDVKREAEAFERTLSPHVKDKLRQMMPAAMASAQMQQNQAEAAKEESLAIAQAAQGLSEDDAKRLVEEAAKKGEISSEEASMLLGKTVEPEKKKGVFGKLFGSKNK